MTAATTEKTSIIPPHSYENAKVKRSIKVVPPENHVSYVMKKAQMIERWIESCSCADYVSMNCKNSRSLSFHMIRMQYMCLNVMFLLTLRLCDNNRMEI